MSCKWCGRDARNNLPVRVSVRRHGQLELSLCTICGPLLFAEALATASDQDDYEILSRAQAAVDARFESIFHSGHGASDRCWWCSRPGAAVECAYREDGCVLFENPVMCDICTALAGHVAGGFATVDEARWEAIEAAIDLLARSRQAASRPMRERSVELVLAKLALLEMDASDYGFTYPGAGYHELADSLGLSEEETRTQIMRLFEEPEPLVSFRRFDGVVSPVLSARGRLRLRGLQREYRLGRPHASSALRSPSLRRALAKLEPVPVAT